MKQVEYVWTVDQYCDRVLRRNLGDVQKAERGDTIWTRKVSHFPTEKEAWSFAMHRAEMEASIAEHKMKLAKARMNRCMKRLLQSR